MVDPNILRFDKLGGILPCVVQDSRTRNVLMLGFMNKEALLKTLDERKITFFSRSKQRLWTKGETSGHSLDLVDIISDCDSDTLLARVKPNGPTCHTGSDTCFNESNHGQGLSFLEEIIADRKARPVPGSYTNRLLDSGINKVAQKVGEEAVELVIEAKDNNHELFINEAADLMYHFLVLLSAKAVTLDEVVGVLNTRHSAAKG
jgi:phosphoribosyl-ATP pyrophosphohydrolase/phosphoribosyl-AMP cyclohydrolase